MKTSNKILMNHGDGGELWNSLLREVIIPCFPDVQTLDGAVLDEEKDCRTVFSTDSYVVKPIFFPGGDIGSLAVNGSINDLAMMGGRPVALSCGLILEEGFLIQDLINVCQSMYRAAKKVGMKVVTGDTKVVGRGEADGIYINTSGIGSTPFDLEFSSSRIQPGDAIIINGGIGEHGTVILAKRHSITFDPELSSDSTPLWPVVSAMLEKGITPRVMRDLTRGGLAAAAWELAQGLTVDFIIDEQAIPVDYRVKKAGNIWGIDPLNIACEGRFISIMDSNEVDEALRILKEFGFSSASHIGNVQYGAGKVILQTKVGRRKIRPLATEMMPRIC